MPTADGTYQTVITINGKIDDAIFKGIAKLGTETTKVVKQEKELGTESKKSFEALEKGMAKATTKGKEIAIAMKDMLLPLLGISVAFKGMQTIGDTLQLAIDKFKGAKEAAAAFKASVQDVVGKGKLPRWDDFFGTQSTHVLERFRGPAGPVYGRGMTRAIQNAFIQQHMQPSNKLIQSVIEKAVHSQGGLGITPDQAAEIAAKWATFIKLQRGRIPPEMISELGLSSVKDLQKMTRGQKEALLLKEFGGMTDVEDLIKENPHMAELLGLKVKETKALGETGGPLADLQTQGQIISTSLEMAFLPVLKTISEAIDKYLKEPMETVKSLVQSLGWDLEFVFNPKGDIAMGLNPDFSKLNFGQRVVKVWQDDVVPDLKMAWDVFMDYAIEAFRTAGNVFNTVILGLQKAKILPEGTLENLQAILPGIGKAAVDLYNAAEAFAKISWDKMQTAAISIGEAAQHFNDAVNALKGTGSKLVAPTTPSGTPLPNMEVFASGGFVNAPQVGLVGEAGRESIVPLTKRDSNTLDILAGTFSALGINPTDPNAYGHELFDATRMGPGGGMGGPGGFTGMSGGILYTEYGPSIDPPGSADYDSNSYNRIGAWPGITGRLTPSDVALGYGAQAFYGVSPGQTFTDTRGNTVRFADRSGSKNPMNEDVFRLAAGGIVSKKMLSWLGDAGKEAVIPLEGARGKRALAGLQGGSTGHTFNFSPNINVSGVATSEVVDNLVDELRRNFGSWMEDAHFEHERRAFS